MCNAEKIGRETRMMKWVVQSFSFIVLVTSCVIVVPLVFLVIIMSFSKAQPGREQVLLNHLYIFFSGVSVTIREVDCDGLTEKINR